MDRRSGVDRRRANQIAAAPQGESEQSAPAPTAAATTPTAGE